MSKKLILVVEDEKVERNLISEVLETLGYDTVEAENGKIALQMMDENNIDLILSDINMPEMDGLELFRKVRENNDKIPIILMTGFDAEEAKKITKDYKASALLTKPFRLMQLKEIIDRLI
ncbi:MAG: response regulator [Candidatus Hatepunaea meridiana]|nr:response regulator [Candidatus Hatepunaea meridiana]